ncbi:MAG: hydrogenase maturation nickel metallochaperone HypA/HybF [Candidatus Hodarchaeales archaeon]
MHEFSIAQMIHEQLVEVIEKHNGKSVKRVKLKIGEFSLIVVEQLDFCLKIASEEDDRFKNCEYEYETDPGKIRCLSCDYTGKSVNLYDNPLYKDIGFTMAYTCPSCNSNDTKIIAGSDMVIDSLELEMGD